MSDSSLLYRGNARGVSVHPFPRGDGVLFNSAVVWDCLELAPVRHKIVTRSEDTHRTKMGNFLSDAPPSRAQWRALYLRGNGQHLTSQIASDHLETTVTHALVVKPQDD